MAQVYNNYAQVKTQLGRESTAGQAVAATVIWRGPFASLEDARTKVTVEENIGLSVTAERTYTSQYLGRLAMPATELTFAQVVHILEAGIKTATPSGANPYVYTYTLPTDNTVNTIKTYTIEMVPVVATSDYREMPYSFVEEFTFEGTAGEAWKMSANWVGQKLATGTATALSTLQTGNDMIPAMMPMTKLYIDATGGTVGTTQKTGVLMGASMRVRTGWVVVPIGDGNLYFQKIKFTKPEITFSLTLELEQDVAASVVAAERLIYEGDTVRLFQLLADGPSASQSLTLQWAGKYDRIGGYSNNNGNTTVMLEGHAVYSSADALFWSCAVENTLSTIP